MDPKMDPKMVLKYSENVLEYPKKVLKFLIDPVPSKMT